nr:AMP-binding protein [Hydrogenophaga sp. PAMC20947]
MKSPSQMAGYCDMPELNTESFAEDGHFRTGDLGRYDANGLLVSAGLARKRVSRWPKASMGRPLQ